MSVTSDGALLEEVFEAAAKEFATWPKWKQDLATAECAGTEEAPTVPDVDCND
jgi:hypothetical protein